MTSSEQIQGDERPTSGVPDGSGAGRSGRSREASTDRSDWSGTWPAGWHVQHVDATGSTNTDLLAAAARGAPTRTVLAADHQTAGRGRLDRRWEAPPGANLLVSLLFRDVPDPPGELVRRTALAAADACRRVAGAEVWLKWPNDLLLDGRKLAGILSQRAPGASGPGSGAAGAGGAPLEAGPVVVGLGLNVGWAPEAGARLGDTVSRPALLRALLEAHDELPDDGQELMTRYRERLDTLGRRVRVEVPDGEVVGRATDVDDDGRLVVLDECGVTHRLDVGDVVHVRPTGGDGDDGDGVVARDAEPRG